MAKPHLSIRWPGIAALIGLLVMVYTLSNAGVFHIIDEDSRFAVTESVALRGDLDTNAIAWTQWVNTPREAQGDFGPNGEVYSKKGPAQPLLSVVWYLLLLVPLRLLSAYFEISLGMLQWSMLFSGVITAITAALVWLTAIRLGYADRVGCVLALLFGLATIAWPYATYLLAEPLSALSLLFSFYALVVWRNHLNSHAKSPDNASDMPVDHISAAGTKWLWLAGIAGGVAVATTIVHVLLIGVLGLYWLILAGHALGSLEATGQRKATLLLQWGIPFVMPLALTALLMVAYNSARFGLFWNTGYQIFDGEFFITPLWQGVCGLLFSPYRSFFLHSPVFIASLLAFPLFYRRHRFEALTILGISLVIIVLYGKWWMWWGGYAWGPRFLVPLAPFWILLLAPLMQRWLPTPEQKHHNGQTTTKIWSRLAGNSFGYRTNVCRCRQFC